MPDEKDHSSLWLWTGGVMVAGVAVTIGISGSFAASRKHFNFWTTPSTVIGYVMLVIMAVCLVAAARGVRFPFNGSQDAERRARLAAADVLAGFYRDGQAVRFSTESPQKWMEDADEWRHGTSDWIEANLSLADSVKFDDWSTLPTGPDVADDDLVRLAIDRQLSNLLTIIERLRQ